MTINPSARSTSENGCLNGDCVVLWEVQASGRKSDNDIARGNCILSARFSRRHPKADSRSDDGRIEDAGVSYFQLLKVETRLQRAL